MTLQQFADELWLVNGDRIHMLGIPFDTRMCVVRLADGGIWLHSPVAISVELIVAVESLGPVRHIVAPNKFHHLFAREWIDAFPYATAWAGPGLIERVQTRFDQELGDQAEACWGQDIDQLIFGGSRILNEAVFFHRQSRTLILTDIFQNHAPEADNWIWRNLKRLNGIGGPDGGAPRDWRLSVRDRETARAARDRMLSWDFDRVVISHGLCIQTGARAQIERAFAWLG
ncbi:Methanol oxidation glmU-like protein [Enhygromyxa salina]|uniref:Methanol oxidation glmU-like protein n=1 Tax=Enhygromyxa salina TaxID=215803 RepID=A0A0C2D0T4_9BACT|nr:DUF4336 domain-containing protein [Enhygromyxa salina]KIG16851.1 Methanol oxidation glmU-like protein [Enhygromyxa salina]